MTDLTISIATKNNKRLLAQCIKSIYESTKGLSFEIYVVDDNSTDGTLGMLNNDFPEVKTIKAPLESSFSSNHNMILKKAKGEYLIILNDDTIIKNKAFEKMHSYLKNNSKIGIIGPRMSFADGTYQNNAFKFPTLFDFAWGLFFYRFSSKRAPALYDSIRDVVREKEVDWLLGACLMLPRSIVEQIGYFDEGFAPLYAEDTDLCKRIKGIGYKVIYYPEAEIIHYGAQSTMRIKRDFYDKVIAQSRLKFFKKHHNIFYYLCAVIIFACANLLNSIIRLIKLCVKNCL